MKKAIRHLKGLFVVIFILTAAFMPLTVSAQSTCTGTASDIVDITVEGAQGTSVFRITCLNHNGRFWTYRVQELPGSKHDLSHWILGIVTCLPENIVSPTSSGNVSIGRDGSTGFTGIKWNVADGFTTADFTIELDNDYSAALMPIQVLAKASNGSSIGNITGPDCSTTAIELASFSAVRMGSSISLQWETAVEIDNAGFNIYRTTGLNAPLVKINDELIAATGSGSSYSFSDAAGSGGEYYVLEDIDTSGVATRHVPVARAAQSQKYIFLPMIGETH